MFKYGEVYKYRNQADSKAEYVIVADTTENFHDVFVIVCLYDGKFQTIGAFDNEQKAQSCMQMLTQIKEV